MRRYNCIYFPHLVRRKTKAKKLNTCKIRNMALYVIILNIGHRTVTEYRRLDRWLMMTTRTYLKRSIKRNLYTPKSRSYIRTLRLARTR